MEGSNVGLFGGALLSVVPNVLLPIRLTTMLQRLVNTKQRHFLKVSQELRDQHTKIKGKLAYQKGKIT